MTNPELKLEVGKTYLDRLGREVIVLREDRTARYDSCYRFAVSYPVDDCADYYVSASGRFLYGELHDWDLIAEKPAAIREGEALEGGT